ncbi:MAG: class I mannose-6-phosphate isomerase [Lachnospiraceae bacterium]|nr:class I mannose-6-phosphate isomerase [Lachnospiraceae bacterium]
MIKRNMQWSEGKLHLEEPVAAGAFAKKSANPANAPLLLKPAGKDYLWGGTRLNDDFSKNIPMEPLAETWECSTHPDGPSTVVNGPFANATLAEVLRLHPEYLGTHPRTNGGLPILIKLIDADKDLSVQVHPDDEYARKHEGGQLGKTEMWYVLDACKDASLVYGLRHDMTPEKVRANIEMGTLGRHLLRVKVRKDDVFYVEAGTIHAIGAGTLVAEIQENSNLTYRLYDYGRKGRDGRERELHIDKALDVADLKAAKEPRQPMRVLRYRRGCAAELLGRCKYFEVHRMLVNTERCREMVAFQSDASSFRVLLCVDGCGCIFYAGNGVRPDSENRILPDILGGSSAGCAAKYDVPDMSNDLEASGGFPADEGEAGYEPQMEVLRFYKGDCIFVPADSVEIRIHGQAQFLDVRG